MAEFRSKGEIFIWIILCRATTENEFCRIDFISDISAFKEIIQIVSRYDG